MVTRRHGIPNHHRPQLSPEALDDNLARSLKLRIGLIKGEIRKLAAERDQAVEFFYDKLDHIDALADDLFRLTRDLWRVERRQAQRVFKRRQSGAAA